MAYTLAKVVPFIRLPRGMDFFDYAVPDEMAGAVFEGCRVEIPFRKKKIDGIVWELADGETKDLKKINGLFPASGLSRQQMRLCDWAADFYACSRSLILPLTAGPRMKRGAKKAAVSSVSQSRFLAGTTTVYRWTDFAWRDTHLCATVQTHLKKQQQIMIVCPTIQRVEEVCVLLNKKCGKKLLVFTRELSKGAEALARQQMRDDSCDVAVGTRILAFADMPRLATIVIDAAHRDEHCQYDMNPRYDARTVAAWRAAHQGINIELMSPCPRIEDMQGHTYREHRGQLPRQTVVSLPALWRTRGSGFVSPQLEESARSALTAGRDALFLVGKKGYGSQMICRDCEWVHTCESCRAALPGVRTPSAVCRACTRENSVPTRCPACKGVRFLFPGMGIQKILAEARALFPDVRCIEFSKDTKASHEVTQYCQQANPSGTLVIATSLLPEEYASIFSRFDVVGVIAADAANTHLNFRGQEHQWRTLRTTALLAAKNNCELILQCFSPNSPFVENFLADDYQGFAARTLQERKKFCWPPYGRCAVLYPKGTRPIDSVLGALSPAARDGVSLSILSRGTQDERVLARFSTCAAVELPSGARELFRSLPPQWLVDTDPIVL